MYPPPDQRTDIILRYRRSKALVFAAIMLGIGGMIGWVAWDAIDPAWRAPSDDGALLQALPAFVRVPFFVVVGLVVLAPGVWILWAGLANLPVVRMDDQNISSRTIFGRQRRLAWHMVGSVRRLRRENQIVLSPVGNSGLLAEIWDRKSVLIDVGMLDRPVADVEALIRRFRPDLTIDDRSSRDD